MDTIIAPEVRIRLSVWNDNTVSGEFVSGPKNGRIYVKASKSITAAAVKFFSDKPNDLVRFDPRTVSIDGTDQIVTDFVTRGVWSITADETGAVKFTRIEARAIGCLLTGEGVELIKTTQPAPAATAGADADLI